MLEELLWAKSKPHKSLKAHMIDSGMCALEYLSAPSSVSLLAYLQENWQCSAEHAMQEAAYICAIHDIGKAYPSFVKQSEAECLRWKDAGKETLLKERTIEGFRHEHYGARRLKKIWENELRVDAERIIVDSHAVSQHHQKCEKTKIYPIRQRKEWEQAQVELERDLRAIFFPCGDMSRVSHMDAECMFLQGLVILCDWVASSKPFELLPEGAGYELRSRKVAAETLTAYGLIGVSRFPEIQSFSHMWPWIKMPRPLQRTCETLSDQALLTIIEAPMGDGKTEAALYFAGRICNAQKKRGIYVALPTQATSNGMYARVCEMLERMGTDDARLMHGTAFLLEEEAGSFAGQAEREAAQWLKPMRLALLGSNAVGTVDQVMASMLRIRFSVLRLFGLMNKVLIIDEVHAYDCYMAQIIETLLKWCCVLRIPVILLSATMRDAQRQAYMDCYHARMMENVQQEYPLITQVDADGNVQTYYPEASTPREYAFRSVGILEDLAGVAERAVDRISAGGCICVLMNTVREAQDVYREIQRIRPADCEVLLFHARFTVQQRNQIEKKCLALFGKEEKNRPAKAILVATQVVEQSLDLDFDTMISQIAPVDLLLQRAGRVHRHSGRKRPRGLGEPIVEVLMPGRDQAELDKRYGLSGYVYDPYLLFNTERLLKGERRLRVPEDIRPVIEAVYQEITEENIQSYMKRQTEASYQQAQALSNIIGEPDPHSCFSAETVVEWDLPEIDDGFEPNMRPSTRLGERSVRIAFCGKALHQRAMSGQLTKAEMRSVFLSSVSLPLRKLDYDKDIAPRALNKGMLKGCVIADSQTDYAIGGYRLVNDPELGILIIEASNAKEESGCNSPY